MILQVIERQELQRLQKLHAYLKMPMILKMNQKFQQQNSRSHEVHE